MRYYISIAALLLSVVVMAQTDLTAPDLHRTTYISPYYFGPNAFPVPDMSDGTVSADLRLELAGDYYLGFQKDQTADLFLRLNVPLFTDRVNLSLWMPVVEGYWNTLERQRTCRLQDTVRMTGYEFGDVYVSTDIQVLKQKKYLPDFVLRAAIKSASGGGWPNARNYDCPGYFFDGTLAKSIYFKHGFFQELRFAGSAGFLCWQTDNGRQNDAVMYGAQLKLLTSCFSLAQVFTGYVGWENNPSPVKDAHDRPMTLKTNITGYIKNWEILFTYQYGIKDYPFHQFRLGVAYKWDMLSAIEAYKQKKTNH